MKLTNYGNTCYFNSALQCLLRVEIISNALIFDTHVCRSVFTVEYQKMVKMSSSSLPLNLPILLNIFRTRFARFDNAHPHDAQEAFVCMLDLLDQDLVDLAFNGTKVQETVCRSGKKIHHEKFTVDIMTEFSGGGGIAETIANSHKWTTVHDYMDDNGNVYNIAATRQTYGVYPNVLAITFAEMNNGQRNVVLSENLVFGNLSYDLIATCTHVGDTRFGGHYVSLIKKGGGGNSIWALMNDTQCIENVEFPAEARHYLALYMLKNSSC